MYCFVRHSEGEEKAIEKKNNSIYYLLSAKTDSVLQ